MPKNSFVLRSEADREALIARIYELELDVLNPFDVEVYAPSKARSRAQERLYFKHVGEIAMQRGLMPNNDKTPKELFNSTHAYLKKKYLHPLLMMGTTKACVEYQETYLSLNVYKESLNVNDTVRLAQVDNLKMQILSITKISSTKIMKQFIDSYWPDMNTQGFNLTDPDSKHLSA